MLKVLTNAELENNPRASLTPTEELFEHRKLLCKNFEALNSRFLDPEFSQEDDDTLEDKQLRLAEFDKTILDTQPITINDISIMAYLVKYWADIDEMETSLDGFDAKLTRAVAAFFPLEV